MTTNIDTFNADDVIFLAPALGSAKAQESAKFARVPIRIRGADGTPQELILSTGDQRMHSFGLQEKKKEGSDVLDGYRMSVCLHTLDGGIGPYQEKFIAVCNAIAAKASAFCLANKKELGMPNMKEYQLATMGRSITYLKNKDKEEMPDRPVLNCGIISPRTKEGKFNIKSTFWYNGEMVDPYTLLDQKVKVIAAVSADQVFVGAGTIHVMYKLIEADIAFDTDGLPGKRARLIQVPIDPAAQAYSPVPVAPAPTPVDDSKVPDLGDADEDSEDEGSIAESEDSLSAFAAPPAPVSAAAPVTAAPVLAKPAGAVGTKRKTKA